MCLIAHGFTGTIRSWDQDWYNFWVCRFKVRSVAYLLHFFICGVWTIQTGQNALVSLYRLIFAQCCRISQCCDAERQARNDLQPLLQLNPVANSFEVMYPKGGNVDAHVVVLPSPVLNHYPRLWVRVNNYSRFSHSSFRRALKLSMYPFCQGHPASI